MPIKIISFFIIIHLLIAFSVYSNDEIYLNIGDYLSEEFAEKIQSDLSLEKARYGLKFIFGTVFQKENLIGINLSTFHDSVILYILPDCNTILDIEKYPSKYIFERIDKDKFIIQYENQELLFKYVGNNSLDWIAIKLFSGKWADQNGNEFIFYQDGKARINDEIANYSIGRQVHGDRVGVVIDIVKLGNRNYAFKISKNTLFLYEVFVADISKKPKYILKLISKYH